MTIKVTVLFFSVLRDLVGTDQLSFSLTTTGETPLMSDLLSALYGSYPAMENWDSRLLLAVNAEFAQRCSSLSEGDEIALMPPVQGG